MLANVGDIYSVFSVPLQQYVTCQVTHIKPASTPKGNPLAAVLELDWTGDCLPDADAARSMRPQRYNYYFIKDDLDHAYVTANVPPDHVFIANLPPLVEAEVNSYKFGWDVGDGIVRQRNWEKIDPARRAQFKAASRAHKVMIGGKEFAQDATRINDSVLQSIGDLSELDQLPCLMTIETAHGTRELMEYIQRHPFVNELHWQSSSVSEIDISATRLSRLILQPDGVASMRLNPGLKLLSLTAMPSTSLQVEALAQGRDLSLRCVQGMPAIQGLEQLGGLSLTGVRELDLAPVVQRFPSLRELRIWGNPGLASNLQSIAGLTQLQMLTTFDVFGFGADEFPSPQQLPKLATLWMTSVDADVAKAVKTAYKKAATQGLDLMISKPRKPEWLAENLHNPFRDWDGREHISAAVAKKAALAYKKLLATTRTITVDMDAASVQQLLTTMVTAYAEDFNVIDRRAGVIETVEREEIYTVLVDVLEQLELGLGEPGQGQFQRDRLCELFDRLREF
ncbi:MULTISPECIES: hypothetical protein [unclassified Janthinobacterium]|uniref:hypothetical protein n=1 Tax=unclassified Janthinobacterium TaxID=2610881 RepID=UPI00161130DB|nr:MULTISPECIES: hypothetical protein [unclassified Janthinobacterium]MBB5371368.1 hypothetical protein [Janthinobacterium sp. K2C7]MBB5384174.1 hypothetical protein [Janthinobacterium sp. K2Li3]MBB5389366.1 hypothetical protein [Janthinobacterium sp. K2E3]